MSFDRRQKTVFSLVALFGVGLILEVVSWAVFLVAEGRSFSYHRGRDQRAALREDLGSVSDPAQSIELDDIAAAREVVHPYLGFVNNPNGSSGVSVSPLGFTARSSTRPAADYRIAVFGGSVAMLFAVQGEKELAERLEATAELEGKRVRIENYALGGYKQPQQLLALTYLLSLGREFDLLLNIDGFNEITLGRTENYPQQVALHYPRAWKQRVAALPDVEAQRRVGKVAFLRDRRARLAGRYPEAALGLSVTANLIWRLLDRWIAMDLIAAELHAADYDPANRRFQWQGPTESFADDEELVSESVRIWAESSKQMAGLARANGIPYFHFLQPNQYFAGSKPLSEEERRIALAARAPYRLAVEQGYPRLIESGARLAEEGVAFFDLSAAFATIRDPLYVDDCCHFSPRGNEIIAGLIAEQIVESLR